MLKFSQELDSLHPPGQPVELWMDKAQRYTLTTLGTWQKLQHKDTATFLGCCQWLAKGLSGLPWHVQEAFGRNERQNQGLSNLQVRTYQKNLTLPACHRGMVPFYPLGALYSSPFLPSPFLTAFQAGECTLLSTKGSAAVKELKDSC